jgi:hypothetical protein
MDTVDTGRSAGKRGGWRGCKNLKEDLPLERGRLIFNSLLRDDQFIESYKRVESCTVGANEKKFVEVCAPAAWRQCTLRR